jgi:GH25 family lysozyme M1 (1,4-beta-N-acetylmuramidase)
LDSAEKVECDAVAAEDTTVSIPIPDVSNNNPGAASENWAAVKAAGAVAAACKASEGIGFLDQCFGPNWAQMATAGIGCRIAYHFAHPSEDPTANGAVYSEAVGWGGGLEPNDRRALDMEVFEATAGETVAWALAWEQATRSLGGARPLFYTYLGYLEWLGAGNAQALVGVFDLWIADYSTNPPSSVAPWQYWALWQYTDAGSISGIHGQCDMSEVNGAFFTARPATPSPTLAAPIVAAASPDGNGYWLAGADGGVFAFQESFFGSEGGKPINGKVVGMASPGPGGYWLVGADGGVYTFGSAGFYGSHGEQPLAAAVVGMAASPTGTGYYLAGADGGVFCYGDATYVGNATTTQHQPIVGIIAHPGGGYALVACDGGVYAYGCPFDGSEGGKTLAAPIVGACSTPDGGGYWLVGADGGVFAFGDASFCGSMAGKPLDKPVVGMTCTPSGKGYWLCAADGGVFTFGDAAFHGSI